MIIKKSYKAYLLLAYAFLLILYFILKDRFYPLSILFYMTPMLIIILYGLVTSFLLRKIKTPFYVSITTTLFLIAYWLFTHFGLNKTQDIIGTKHMALWNIADQQFLPHPFIEEHLVAKLPEAIAFVEAKKISVSDLRYLHEKLPSYDIRVLKGHMIIMVKGRIIETRQTYLETNSKYNLIRYQNGDKVISLVLVDVSANPLQNRENDLKNILKFCNENAVDFIIGDFNTPYESIHFKAFKEHYNSFHNVSKGFTSTWPYGIPLLELDQIWTSNNMNPLHLKKQYSSFSDHALLLASYQFNQE